MVIGGGLAGLAAAARLAKAGHQVEVHERRSSLGGTWAPYVLDPYARHPAEVLVDDAPCVLGFPAPWRDLFRKSGRPLEAELARTGFALVPAGPQTVVFADGASMLWPTDRGEQFTTVSASYGPAVAGRWRDLVDRLDDVWQTLRPLGLELELRPERLTKAVRRQLLAQLSVAQLAESAGHPQLTALVRSLAYRQGSTPERTPALAAVELSVRRTFGRWQLAPLKAGDGSDLGRSSVLVEALAARLALRKVTVRLNSPVSSIAVRDGRAVGIATAEGERPAAAVITTVDPWQAAELLPGAGWTRSIKAANRGGLRGLRPAAAPTITHQLVEEQVETVCETVSLTATGVPVVTYLRPSGNDERHSVRTVHDFASTVPKPGYGLAWRGFASWGRRPPITTSVNGLFAAGPFSAGGSGASQTILSGALASYACHDLLAPPAGVHQGAPPARA